MDVPALTVASGANGGVEGKVESVQDGKALVRLSGGGQVQVAVDREIPAGTPVTVAAASDGTLQLSVRTPDAELAKLREAIWKTLRSLVGESLASELSAPLAKGDFAAAARSLPSTGTAGSPSDAASELAQGTGPASVATGPIFLSDGSAASPARGDALLAILSRMERNVYAAEFAGQSQVLFGPSDVEPSTRLLARARPLPGGGAVWTPVPAATAVDRALPDRIQAGTDGARELFRWAGVQDAGPEDEADLGKALADAARSLLDGTREDAADVAPTPVATGTEWVEGRGLEEAPASGAPAAPSPGGSLPVAAQATAVVRTSTPGTRAPSPGDSEATSPSSAAVIPAGSVPVQPSDARASRPSSAQIPSDLAVRVLASWSLDLPDAPAVRKATLGQVAEDLPSTLSNLDALVQKNPGRHPALEAALGDLRETAKLPAGTLADGPRRALEAAVLDALVQESTDRGDAEPLRKAAQALLADRLPERSTDVQGGQTYWTAGNGEWEKARIVVRDERERKGKGRGDAPSDFHSVDVSMDPKELGRVDAHLELRGQVLTTRLEAADAATADLLRQRLPELSQAFSRLGLEPGGLDVRRKAVARVAASHKRGAGGSLDVRA